LFLNKEMFELAKQVQSNKLNVNEVWFEIIDRFLTGKNETTMREILEDCLKIDVRELHNRSYSINAGRILKRLGFEKKDLAVRDGNRYWYVRESVIAQIEKERIIGEEEF